MTRYASMKNQRKKDLTWEFPVEFMARILQVSVSGFYDYLHREPSKTVIRRAGLTLVVKDIFEDFDSTAGYRKVHEACQRDNIVISTDMVKSIMHENHWYSVLDISKGNSHTFLYFNVFLAWSERV